MDEMVFGDPAPDLVPVGLALLRRGWDVAAPFDAGGLLAADVGTEEDRARTCAVVGDLRVPLYSPGVVFVGAGGEEWFRAWRAECDGGDERLAFLRALFRVKPRFCALPRAWHDPKEARDKRDRATALFPEPTPRRRR